MPRNTNNPYAKRRIKVKKPAEQTQNSPFKKDLKRKRNNKVVYFVAGLIIVVMVGTLIFPYFSGTGTTGNYTLPNEVLTANEIKRDPEYNPQKITVGSTFNRVDKDYYVFFGNAQNLDSVAGKITTAPYYLVDSAQGINKSLTTKVADSKALPTVPAQIKIKKDLALIHIKDGKAVKFINNKSEVEKFISELK